MKSSPKVQNKREVESFPIDLARLSKGGFKTPLIKLATQLMRDIDRQSEERRMSFKHDSLTVQCIIPKHSKTLIDEIDSILAQHLGLTTEELDFIVNYDIKYRMGQKEADDGE